LFVWSVCRRPYVPIPPWDE